MPTTARTPDLAILLKQANWRETWLILRTVPTPAPISLSAAKLLYKVEKSHEKGKFILNEFIGEVDENGEPLATDQAFRVLHG
jgi:hypothetical protein